jgi:YYY domain-containing protein
MLLVLILALGFALRLYGLNWDHGTYLHPDERHIVADVMVGRITLSWPPDWSHLLDPAKSTINPRPYNPKTGQYSGFAYGTFPVYITELTAQVAQAATGVDWHSYSREVYLGRAWNVLLDTATILLIYLIGRRVLSVTAGLIAALLYAVSPIAIQLAHFFTTESWVMFFTALSLLFAIEAAERGHKRAFFLTGAAFGLALACKSSVFALGGVLALAIIMDAWSRARLYLSIPRQVSALLIRAFLVAVGTVALFFVGEPFGLLDPRAYWDSMSQQASIQSGQWDVPFTREYIGTPRLWYQLGQLVHWGLGPAIGLAGVIGLAFLAWRSVAWLSRGATVILAWLVLYGAVILLPESKFLRYLLPIVPVFCLAGAALGDRALQWARSGRRIVFAPLVALLIVVPAIATGLSYSAVYAKDQPRLTASVWMFEHLPPGSRTSDEIWDDRLPISLMPGLDSYSRRIDGVSLNLFQDFPTEGDAQQLVTAFNSVSAGQPVARAIAARDYTEAARLLQHAAGAQLASLDADTRVHVAGLLGHAADAMTTSPSLTRATIKSGQTMLQGGETATGGFADLEGELAKLPDQTAAAYLYDNLSQADYYVLASNRVMKGIVTAPWRYPVQIAFYDNLFQGKLGFTLVKDFADYPRLGSIAFPDNTADESFINYDHPHVWVFKKTDFPTRAGFSQLFATSSLQQTYAQREAPDQKSLMLDQPVDQLPVVSDARWSAAWTSHSWVALGFWVVLLIVLQVAARPLVDLVFAGFPDRGRGFGRLLTLLLAGFGVWYLASQQAIAFRAVWCAVAVLVVAAIAWLLARRVRPAALRRDRHAGRIIVAGELVFWGVFAFWLLMRYFNPDSWHPIWGGEKPMEFAHINAILRSAHFPPLDPWYAGGYINYYYYGLYLVAFCFKLTGIPSEIGFNLAQPTVIALLASGAFSVAAALGSRLSRRRNLAIPAGLLGAFCVVFAGNMMSAAQVVNRALQGGGPVDAWGFWVWGPSRAIPNTITEFPYFTALYADLHAHVVALPITVLVIGLSYALSRDPRRILAVVTRPRSVWAETVSVAVTILLLALALGTLYPTNAWDVATYAALTAVALFAATSAIPSLPRRLVLTAASLGVIAVVAAIAFEPFISHYVALYSSLGETRGVTPFNAGLSHFGGWMLIIFIGLVTLLLAHRAVPALAEPIMPLSILGLVLLGLWYASNRGLSMQTAAIDAVVIVVATILLALLWNLAPRRSELNLPPDAVRLLILVAVGAMLYALFTDRQWMAIYVAFGLAAGIAWLALKRPSERFLCAMIAAGMLVGAAIEVVFLADNLRDTDAYRMNTVFKFYNQLWVLFSLASAVLITFMLSRLLASLGSSAPAKTRSHLLGMAPPVAGGAAPGEAPRLVAAPYSLRGRRPAILWSRAGVPIAILVLIATLAYPVTATSPRLHTRFADHLGSQTLNAYVWMKYGTVTTDDGVTIHFADDLAAINWINANIHGSPVIAEASFGPYRCDGSRFSIATGLPDVVGWAYHETQQRTANDLYSRENDLRMLYTTTDVAQKKTVIERYGIDYIIVGQLERNYPQLTQYNCRTAGSAEGIDAFGPMEQTGALTVAYQHGTTTIYKVNI